MVTSKAQISWIIGSLPVLIFAVMVWDARWIGDDGFINTRVVNNLLDGYGPVYNLGERVEVFTSPLWIAILGLLRLCGFQPDIASVYSGFILSVGGMALALAGALGTVNHDSNKSTGWKGRWIPLPLGICTYAVLPPAWDFGTSGLETGLSLFWLGLVAFLLRFVVAGVSRSKGHRISGISYAYTFVLGLGPLIRPELALFSVGMFIPVIVSMNEGRSLRVPRLLRSLVLMGLVMVAVPFAYQVFRMGYFAALTPNTALAKEAFISRWTQGWHYFESFFLLYWLFVPLVVLCIFWFASYLASNSKTMKAALIAPAVCGILYCLYVVKVGGGFMHGRLFLPGIFGLLIPVAAVSPDFFWRAKRELVGKIVLLIVLLFWVVYCAATLRPPAEMQNNIVDERRWYTKSLPNKNPVTVMDYETFFFYKTGQKLRSQAAKSCPEGAISLAGKPHPKCRRFVLADKRKHGLLAKGRKKFPLDSSKTSPREVMAVVRGGVGIAGVVAGSSVHIADRHGLIDPIGSRLKLARRRRPGHEKLFNNTWLAARFSKEEKNENKEVSAARRALECAPVSDLIEAVSRPMSVDRFLLNLGNAYRFHKLRIPRDPHDAERLFCQRSRTS